MAWLLLLPCRLPSPSSQSTPSTGKGRSRSPQHSMKQSDAALQLMQNMKFLGQHLFRSPECVSVFPHSPSSTASYPIHHPFTIQQLPHAISSTVGLRALRLNLQESAVESAELIVLICPIVPSGELLRLDFR